MTAGDASHMSAQPSRRHVTGWKAGAVVTAPSGVRTLGATLLVTGALAAGACVDAGGDPVTGTPEPEDFLVQLAITNPGDGSGTVVTDFSAGTVTDGCPAVIGPDVTCTRSAEHTSRIASISVEAEPEPDSDFAGYGGICSGTESECTISVPMETTVQLTVEASFLLNVRRIDIVPEGDTIAVGGDVSLSATAYADTEGTREVEQAEFTWSSSDPGVAAVSPTGPGSTTNVSGIGAGEAWIRATARQKTDSVKVVVE